jgi:hypothetical protein
MDIISCAFEYDQGSWNRTIIVRLFMQNIPGIPCLASSLYLLSMKQYHTAVCVCVCVCVCGGGCALTPRPLPPPIYPCVSAPLLITLIPTDLFSVLSLYQHHDMASLQTSEVESSSLYLMRCSDFVCCETRQRICNLKMCLFFCMSWSVMADTRNVTASCWEVITNGPR